MYIYRVDQAEYIIRFRVPASQEYVNIYSTPRVRGQPKEYGGGRLPWRYLPAQGLRINPKMALELVRREREIIALFLTFNGSAVPENSTALTKAQGRYSP